MLQHRCLLYQKMNVWDAFPEFLTSLCDGWEENALLNTRAERKALITYRLRNNDIAVARRVHAELQLVPPLHVGQEARREALVRALLGKVELLEQRGELHVRLPLLHEYTKTA